MFLDVKTIFIVTTLLNLLLGGIYFFYYKSRTTYPGFKIWCLSFWVKFIAYLSIILRPFFSTALSIFLTNLCICLAEAIRLDGISAFMLNSRMKRALYLIPLLAGSVCTFFYYHTDLIHVRNLVTTFTTSVFVLMLARIIYVKRPAGSPVFHFFTVILLFVGVIAACTRALLWLWHGQGGLYTTSLLENTLFLSVVFFEVAVAIVFILLNVNRAAHELEDTNSKLEQTNLKLTRALDELKTLKGIIPICAYCGKLKDDKGAWKEVQKYIMDHTEVRFSHGICLECRKKIQPGD